MRRLLAAILGFAILSGCALAPRGAGLQSEVLAAQNKLDMHGQTQFAIETVTHKNLPIFAQWPSLNTTNLSWIERTEQSNNRIIAAGDTVTITVWSNEENGLLQSPGQRSVTLPDQRVSSSGNVFLPYVGEQRISGMSPERARQIIQENYSVVSPSAQVNLSLIEGPAQAVSVVSGVRMPGSYTLVDNGVTILQILSEAGGLMSDLKNPQVRLQRAGKLYGISAKLLLSTPNLNTTLRGGDMIFVEADERTFMSLGAAGTEAVHSFPKSRVTALEALSIIGGLSDARANAGGILILRRYPVSAVRQGSRPDQITPAQYSHWI